MRFALALTCAAGLVAGTTVSPALHNVIFFVCDDLRPQLNKAYGHPEMVTPNLDEFANTALTFDWAFTNFAICSPSRNSFMTGRQPDHTRVWNFRQDFRQAGIGKTGIAGADWVTLPQYFKQHGFLTLGHGKLYHPGKPPKWDEPKSWSQLQPYGPEHITGCAKENFCPEAGPPDKFSDYNTTTDAIATLGIMAEHYHTAGTPFFLGVGMHYPHQPWNTPSELSWLYPGATKGLAPPKFPGTPAGAPDVALSAELDGNDHLFLDFSSPALANRTHDPDLPASCVGQESFACPSPGNNTVPPHFTQYMRLGYYTAVTASDQHFGMLMRALDESGLANNTLVVVLGDHGWELGEHSHYGKHTAFDLSVHVPLLVRAPWLPASAGKHTASYVELLDLYRSLASLAGLPAPQDDVEGDDFSPLLANPAAVLKDAAFAQYSRCPGERNFPTVDDLPDWALNNCEDVPVVNITYMGYTVRTPDWRFTEWYSWNRALCVAQWDQVPRGTELYSHAGHIAPGDFDNYENVNVADEPANAATVTTLRAKLWARFKGPGSGCPPDQPGSLEWPHAPLQEDSVAPSASAADVGSTAPSQEGFIGLFAGACPPGWAEFAPAQGRLLMLVNSSYEAGNSVGLLPLADGEDRVHAHAVSGSFSFPSKSVASVGGGNTKGARSGTQPLLPFYNSSAPATSGLPFVQLQPCRFSALSLQPPPALPEGGVALWDPAVAPDACPAGSAPVGAAGGRALVVAGSGAPPLVTGGDAVHPGAALGAHAHGFTASISLGSVEFVGIAGCCDHDPTDDEGKSATGATSTVDTGLPYLTILGCNTTSAGRAVAAPHGFVLLTLAPSGCPPGWAPLAPALAGRFVVGTPPFGVPSNAFGGAPIPPSGSWAPVHAHAFAVSVATTPAGIGLDSGCCAKGYGAAGTYEASGNTEGEAAPVPFAAVAACQQV